MLKFSLILPIYNVEKFLPDCLDSLYAQDLSEDEYEIICVIDGSPDNSVEVVKGYMQFHRNIVLIEQENQGVCVARNKGFEQAKGKYIWFIDPDDMISANCLGQLLNLLESSHADLIEFDYRTCLEDNRFDNSEIAISIEGNNKPWSSGSGWLSVCRSSYLRDNHIIWDERLSYGEDYLWAFQTKYRQHKSIYTKAKVYIYRQRNQSAMHSSGNREKEEKHVADMLLLSEIYRDEYSRCENEHMNDDVLENIRRRQQLCNEGALLCLLKMGVPGKEVKERLNHIIERGLYPYPLLTWNFFTKGTVNPLRNRVFTFLFPWRPYYLLMCFVYRTFHRKGSCS